MKYKITLNGKVYEVVVERGEALLADTYDAALPAAPQIAPTAPSAPVAAPAPAAAPAAPQIAGEPIKSPMPGTILAVNIQPGAAVKSGQVLFILEAMKMENEIVAPRDGTVSAVAVKKGDAVDTGAVLAALA
jgi:biotin carboxyl carrier protein